MSAKKTTINLEWLSDCGGCHVVVVDLHEKILDVLGEAAIQHCPVLTDIKDYPRADVGLVSGAIRNEHDRHMAEQMRASCGVIVAFGTCAVYGGIPGAALAHSRAEILDTVYRRSRTTPPAEPPSAQVAPLEKIVTPLDEVIEVDLYLPGCPPHPRFIFEALRSLVSGRRAPEEVETVCGRCKRTMLRRDTAEISNIQEKIPEPDVCFLSQGLICLGSVTLDRCLAPCPAKGTVCTGCAGPSIQILTEPNRDIRTEVAERMSRLTAIGAGRVVENIEQAAKSHYCYAMATRMIGNKPTFQIHKWIAEAEAGL